MSFGGPPPGGFGGPPPDGGGFGGPPPGGGFGGPPGGPPQGGPPPGGGYGPPPGGGFGGPPPGGPFGGPPQGGPFGGPPQGGPFGPPQGGQFGGPQVGFGAPIPPQKSGTSVGMIVGIGCGALALLGIIGTVVGMLAFRRAATSSPPPAYSPPPIATPTPTKAGGGSGALKAELKELTAIKSKYGKSTRFIGEILNTGADPIGYPSAKVTFYDSAGTAVDSGTCTSLIRILPANDKVPCAFSIFKGLDWANYKIEMTPYPPSFQGESADIDITDIKFTPKRGYKPDTLEGKLTNKSNFKAKNVWAIVSLYDANKKIIGADNTLVAGNDLEAGASGLFSAKVYEVAGTPESYRVVSVGYSQ